MFFKRNFLRWVKDPKCKGPFPKNYEKYERTLRDVRKTRFGKSPTTPREIELEFQKPEIFNDLGQSLAGGIIYNGIQIEEGFSNCIFSSPQSILLVKESLEPEERFFLMDATFRITPRGEFQQVLIIYIKYGIKVRINYSTEKLTIEVLTESFICNNRIFVFVDNSIIIS